jgi:hypothetical protein
MEVYRTTCPNCGYIRTWVGYKTGIGKTEAQIEKMQRDAITCINCGSQEATTELDRESGAGKAFGEADALVANIICDILKQKTSMLGYLHEAERALPQLLEDESAWHSVYVDYDFPIVERLWYPWGNFRISLHKIHPCETSDALFHPHPWPSAIKILDGNYEMGVGYGNGENKPPVAAKIIMGVGSEYEMSDPDGWHYVRPIGGPSISLMITGLPWGRPSPKSEKQLNPLHEVQKKELLNFFRKKYTSK